MSKKPGYKIAFVHPDLGIGGAERLVVDAAVGLQDLDNDVIIYTSHCDLTHCFEEVSSGQLKVSVHGDFLPTNIFKKFHILFAILRQFYLVLSLIISGKIKDLFSAPHCRVLFYCHFPDQLLAKRLSFIKSLYRVPFDFIEEWTTGWSDQIVVNSNFTKQIFHDTFKRLGAVDPGVIYPCVDTEIVEDAECDAEVNKFFKDSRYFLSINRFERAKNIDLAIQAFAKLKKLIPGKPRLVIAGGYDSRVMENVEYLKELCSLCDKLKLTNFTIRGKLIVMPPATDVLFLPSIRTSLKTSLLKQTELLLYTPGREHFGIVPVEMLAINFGGPLETVYEKWAKIMIKYYNDTDTSIKKQLGENGYNRVLENFSRDETSKEFVRNLQEASKKNAIKVPELSRFIPFFAIAISYIIYRLFLV
ncbi:Alpha-1,3/1,6-mannosyltransferase ALG2 [Candida viswanathii]|uniref:Alpha-1,3/1,6-mannosyltransferase ALG2 n=1 Tax=Candida viswanathii TaxID=5486 RepID=A0A367XW69_9ASCO|nr:Alpha-1,3/1,6-mannosyltransferase ALG2 [Candida viswanathii]